jgi:prepilin-type N-terminal cleavage/methylation domain-containing protein
MKRNTRKGFTLVEIMIVVLIIGILLAIAVPNFMRARDTSRNKTIATTLSKIDAAKEQCAMDSGLATGDTCNTVSNYLSVPYTQAAGVAKWPIAGKAYVEGAIGAKASYDGHDSDWWSAQ